MIAPDAFLRVERSPLEFTVALGLLQVLIGAEVTIVLNAYGKFFGAGFTGRLLRVETLPPDDMAIRLVLEGGHGLFLDPADVEAFRIAESLEFQLAFGITVTIEPTAPDRRQAQTS